MQIAEALRLIRTRQGLTQTAASKREGAPDFRTISHWETKRKDPSLRLLYSYLRSLSLDFCDLQEALDEVDGTAAKRRRNEFEGIEQRLVDHERQLQQLEGGDNGPP